MNTDKHVFKTLKSELIKLIPGVNESDISEQSSLRDLGANSIDRFEIINNTLHALEVQISLTEFSDCKNVGDIVNIIKNKAF